MKKYQISEEIYKIKIETNKINEKYIDQDNNKIEELYGNRIRQLQEICEENDWHEYLNVVDLSDSKQYWKCIVCDKLIEMD